MHEITLVTSLFEIINQQVAVHGMTKVTAVHLKVGEMAGVEPMTLTACFDVVAEGTPAAGARLVIEDVPLMGKCRSCGERFNIQGYRFVCPLCVGENVELVGGRELYIDRLEGTCEGDHNEATAA